MGKVVITGTGRCGTTFLMIIYTYLNMDTGYNISNLQLYENCNSGLEREITCPFRVVKKPRFILTIGKILKSFEVDFIVVPERPYEECARSREKHGKKPGGFFGAKDYQSQLSFYIENMQKFKKSVEGHNVIYLDFYQMISSAEYTYEKLNPTFDRDVSLEEFILAYEFATNNQRKK